MNDSFPNCQWDDSRRIVTKTHALKLILLSIGIIKMYLLEVFCDTHHLIPDCGISFALVLLGVFFALVSGHQKKV